MYLCRLETTMKRHQKLLIRTIKDSNCDIRNFGFPPLHLQNNKTE